MSWMPPAANKDQALNSDSCLLTPDSCLPTPDSSLLTPDPWLRVAFCLWIILGLAVSIRTIVQPVRHTVFPVFAEGAMHWWSGQSLYAKYAGLDSFRYCPTFAIAMTPFAAAGNLAGGIVWSWMNIGVFVWGLRRLLRDVLPGEWPPAREAALQMLALVGALRSVWNAQSNPLVIGLLMLAAAALARRRWWLAAVLFTGPVFLKLTPIAVVMLLCALWPRKLIGRFALIMLAGLMLPFCTMPPTSVVMQYQEWFTHLISSSGARWMGFRDGWTVWLLIENVIHAGPELDVLKEPISSPIYRILQFAAAGGTLAWCLWQQRSLTHQAFQPESWRSQPGRPDLVEGERRLVLNGLTIGLAWLMIFGPAVEYPTYVLLAPFVSWSVLEAIASRRGVILAVAAWLLTTVVPCLEPQGAGPASFLFAALPCGSALFTFWLLRHVPREAEAIPQLHALSVAA